METLFTPLARRLGNVLRHGRAIGVLLLLAIGSQQAQAQQTRTFPRVESFKGGTTDGFTLFGNARLTSLTEAGTTGDGYLRLTDAVDFQAGTAIDEFAFPAPQGFSISFEFFSYGGVGNTNLGGADGFSVYLIDGATSQFRIGADGGSLGYAQRTATNGTIVPGVSNGYIGLGIDEYGNFANSDENRSGGLVNGAILVPDAITIRGKGNGNTATDYPFIASSNTLPFALDAATARAQSGNDYRRAFIDFIPFTNSNGVASYRITFRIQHGNTITTALSNVEVPPPPPTLRIGFSGSTGGNNNVHEIRNLAVVRPTIANNDRMGTRYGTPVSTNVTTNDEAPGSSLDLATIDLNPLTATVERELTVADKGKFTVDAQGIVTFVPVSTFAGVVTIPYTIRDILGTLSNQADITVIVTGADLATSVSGPTTANPSSSVTYLVSTTNIGLETANNVVSTLRLPSGATVTDQPAGSSITTSGSVQIITFATVPTLAPNAQPIVNSVTFTMPASTTGSITGTAASNSTLGTTPFVPDPNTVNNTASIITTATGLANIAAACATPGNDGPATLANGAIPNTYYPGTASAAIGANSISVGAAVGSTPIAAGDLLLVVQMQGAEINTANTTAYGSNTGTGSGNLGNANYTAGTYEYAIAAGPVTNGTVPLSTKLVNAYSNAAITATIGLRRFQVIRVPQYSSLTINGTVTGADWNGSTGGVLVVDVAGRTTFGTGGRLDMNGRGFRGGGGFTYTGNNSYDTNDYVMPAATTASGAHGAKGEGFAGTPRFVNNNGVVLNTATEGYPVGSVGAGAPGNAGGGGTDGAPKATSGNPNIRGNGRNTGGGGGGNGGNGGKGGEFNNVTSLGGRAGVAAGSASASRLFLGGGGGAGSTNSPTPSVSSGADGGGIIILRTGSVAGTGSISANGDAATADAIDYGGGGGGAGGTVIINAQLTTDMNEITVSVNGGKGGNALASDASYGAGGGGGGGLVYANSTLSATSSATGGAQGLTRSGGASSANGVIGNPGTVIQTSATANIPAGIASSTSCMPTLTAALSTSTPSITRVNETAVNPARYTLNVSNTGGSAKTVSATITMDNSGTSGTASGLITYSSTNTVVTVTLANGTVNTLTAGTGYTLNTTTAGAPAFSNISLPAGARLTIAFQAAIASAAVNNKAYQSAVAVDFLDPTRTSATGQVSPTGTFAGGGTVAGRNYIATSSTAEDVTIVRPLPVELKQFSVKAVRQDAQLNWSTASELNNDRFVVERSLDGLTFSAVGTVRGKGNSTQQSNYSFTDAGAARFGALIYYRLKQLDFDGVATFSPVRSVKFVDAIKVDVSVYPNPTQGGATLDLTGLPAGNYQVQLLDLTGRSLQVLTLAGQQEHPLPVQALPHGSYIVRVRGAAVSVALPLVRN